MSDLITMCLGCEKPIAGTNGVIHIRYRDVYDVEDAVRIWNAKVDADPMNAEYVGKTAERFIRGDLLLTYPDSAVWLVHCNDCNPHAHGDGTMCGDCYWFDVGRCTTWGELIEWTCHLNEKEWFKHTDWFDMLRAVPGGQGRRLRAAS